MGTAHVTSYCICRKDNCQVKFSKKEMAPVPIFDSIVQVSLPAPPKEAAGKEAGFSPKRAGFLRPAML